MEGKNTNIFFVPQKLGCWTCCKFSYVQKGAPNVFGLFLPSISSAQSYYIGVHWDSSDRCWTLGEWAAEAVMLLSLYSMRMSKQIMSLLTLHCGHLSAQSRAISWAESRQGAAAAAQHFPEAMDWDGAAAALIDTATAMANVTCSIIELCGAVLLFL